MLTTVPASRRWRLRCGLAGVALVAGCAAPPRETGPANAAPAAASIAADPVAVPAETVVAVAPLSSQEIKTAIERTVVELLEQGQEDQAVDLLERVLKQEPAHKLAANLMRQIRDEPAVLYGRAFFEYRVQPGESLSRIAGRYLGDIYQFYGLAHYNGIKAPRLLAGGQTIRVPGKAPVAAAPPAVAPVQAAVRAAPVVVVAAVSDPEIDAELANAERMEAIARLSRVARVAFAKKEYGGAIAAWDRVLGMDPKNAAAKQERQRALEIAERATSALSTPPPPP